jgi:hypothetical protein
VGQGGNFFGGFFKGVAIGVISSFTMGALTEMTAITEAARAGVTGSWMAFSQAGGVMYGANQVAMMARYGTGAFGMDALFPMGPHHGYWGLLSMFVGAGLSSFLSSDVMWLAGLAYGAGWLASVDDFMQHTVLQNINPTWTSPLHEAWKAIHHKDDEDE